METALQAIYLLADSQLLFWRDEGKLFIETIRTSIEHDSPKAAYVGASNDDNPEYYSIFESAMDSIGIRQCRMIHTALSAEDLAFINEADIILLAGGDVEKGWNAFELNGLKEVIFRRYFEGAILIGVSAGATQLGLYGWKEEEGAPANLIQTFKLVPFIVSAHDEKQDWVPLQKAVQMAGINVRGMAIPHGGGAILRVDQSFEPIRHPVHEFIMRENEMEHNLLLPGIPHPPDIIEAPNVC
jgi:cyanophycinase